MHRATGKIAEALLPVLDACEAAFVQHPVEVEPLFNLLLGAAPEAGPREHEPARAAVRPEPRRGRDARARRGAGGDPVVTEVLRTGYTWKGKVLRPAMVKVRG